MPFTIVRDDITHVRADALVNAANEQLLMGGGVCGAIFKAAGVRKMQKACDKIGHCDTGSAVATPAFALHAHYVIHAVGPIWLGGNHHERSLLASSYRSALELAASLDCQSIAFPLISAGIYGYPHHEALAVAQEEIRAFLDDHEMQVTLVLYDTQVMALADDLRLRVERYIDDVYVGAHTSARSQRERELQQHSSWMALQGSRPDGSDARPAGAETTCCPNCGMPAKPGAIFCAHCGRRISDGADLYGADELAAIPHPVVYEETSAAGPTLFGASAPDGAHAVPCAPPPAAAGKQGAPRIPLPTLSMPNPLRNMLEHLDAGFSETLLAMIDERGLKDAEVYKKANISRQHFSKMRSNPRYKPTKTTVLALAVALELSLDETNLLLERAGFALSHASQRDIIVEFFIREGTYDVFTINETLFAFDQPLLA